MPSPAIGESSTKSLGADFSVPIDDRYFEDYQPGASYEYGHIEITEDDIIEFATRYDPQPIHIDRDWARTGPFGGLIASGWHTSALCMRMYVDHYLSRVAGLASPGIDELRFAVPTRPGDVLRARFTVIEARPSRSKPDRGILFTRMEGFNQNDELAMSAIGMNMVARRPE
ncbi:MAG TPA: MaoC family dehydratase [Sporichthyaceae bacterium]|jgi:acyl dehydratase